MGANLKTEGVAPTSVAWLWSGVGMGREDIYLWSAQISRPIRLIIRLRWASVRTWMMLLTYVWSCRQTVTIVIYTIYLDIRKCICDRYSCISSSSSQTLSVIPVLTEHRLYIVQYYFAIRILHSLISIHSIWLFI